jgi:hypothetical protein
MDEPPPLNSPGPAPPRTRFPYQGLRLNAGHISLLQLRNARTQLGVMAVTGIQQHHAARKAHLTRPANLRERDLRLGLERDVLRHPRFTAMDIVLCPGLRQIQPIRHRQARIVVGKRQRYRDLTVRLLGVIAESVPKRTLSHVEES